MRYPVAVAAVVAALAVTVSGQDAYTQGVVQGATLALAGTAVVGLGAIAIKQHQNRQRFQRYRGYRPYYNQGYNGYYNQGYGGYNNYYPQQQYYRRRRAVPEDSLERDFENVMGQDEGECAMKVVCQLEAKTAAGETVSEFGKLIISLFGTEPVPVPTSALGTARGQYGYAAYVGATSSLETCASLYPTCKYSSEEILENIKASQKVAVPVLPDGEEPKSEPAPASKE